MPDGTRESEHDRASRRWLLAAGAGGLALLAGCSGPGTGEDGEGGEDGEDGEEGESGEEGEDGEEGEGSLRGTGPGRDDVGPAGGPAVR